MTFTLNQHIFCKRKSLELLLSRVFLLHMHQFSLNLKFLTLNLLTFVYESVKRIAPSCLFNFVQILSEVHQYDTRKTRKRDIFMTQENTLPYRLRSVRYAGAKSWNNIPFNIKQAPSAMSFRRQLKFHLFSTKYRP